MNSPLKIAHLLDTDQFAGTEQQVLSLSDALRQSGACPYIVCRRASPLQQAAQARALPTLPLLGEAGFPQTTRRLTQALRAEGMDLVHVHNGRMLLLAALMRRQAGLPTVMTQHFLAPQSTNYRGPKRLAARMAHAWANRRLDHILAISESVRRAMMQREHIGPDRITTVWNGLAPLTAPTTARCQALRRELGITDAQPMCVTLARLTPEKGLSYLLHSIASLRKDWPQARFVLAGEGALRQTLQDQAHSLGIADAVIFTGFRADATDILAASDLCVLPSLAEPFGLVLLEAMALSKPIVATRAGGPLEIVLDEETGLLVPPADPDALAQGIERLLANPSLAQNMGQAGFARFTRHFTAREMAQKTLTVYQAVCRKTAREAAA